AEMHNGLRRECSRLGVRDGRLMNMRRGLLAACRLPLTDKRYSLGRMIKNFRCADTQTLFETGKSRRWSAIGKVATRKLTMLDAASELKDLRSPPGNRLETLEGDRKGQHSIRINDQWRLCFVWTAGGPIEVEITDYH